MPLIRHALFFDAAAYASAAATGEAAFDLRAAISHFAALLRYLMPISYFRCC